MTQQSRPGRVPPHAAACPGRQEGRRARAAGGELRAMPQPRRIPAPPRCLGSRRSPGMGRWVRACTRARDAVGKEQLGSWRVSLRAGAPAGCPCAPHGRARTGPAAAPSASALLLMERDSPGSCACRWPGWFPGTVCNSPVYQKGTEKGMMQPLCTGRTTCFLSYCNDLDSLAEHFVVPFGEQV